MIENIIIGSALVPMVTCSLVAYFSWSFGRKQEKRLWLGAISDMTAESHESDYRKRRVLENLKLRVVTRK